MITNYTSMICCLNNQRLNHRMRQSRPENRTRQHRPPVAGVHDNVTSQQESLEI